LLRALYCVDFAYRPLTGNGAAELGCPRSGDSATFVAQHPGLFDITGYAHHPYSFDAAPTAPPPNPNWLPLSTLPRLEHVLDTIFGVYGKLPPGGVPLYLTEWGYKSNPPNPYVKVSQDQQAAYLNEGEYMTWGDPRVHALTQFLLIDNPPRASFAYGSRKYWGSFQTGLINLDGTPKPAYDAFRIPIWLPDPRHGRHVTVWSQLRPADHSTLQYGVLEYKPSGASSWTQVRELQTANSRGFAVAHVALPSRGLVKVAWLDPANAVVYYSRVVRVR
jgi:hypothetical protein